MQDTGRRQEMLEQLESQKAAYLRDGFPEAKVRKDRLDRAIALLVDNRDALDEAMRADFGARPGVLNDLGDTAGSIRSLKFTKKHLDGWMRSEKRKVEFPLNLLGAKAELRYQPKGSVGILAPWNFPVAMVFQPLACVLGAGNRAMVKPSEFTEATSELMRELIGKYFETDEVAVFTGGPDVGAAFSSLPFDHLVFTGSTSVGRHVMRAAAENLVPVTLELGGKSPAILGKEADFERAAARIMAGKTMNAGQICLAPDYALTPAGKTGEFVDAAVASVRHMYPTIRDNDEYTAMINQKHYDRVLGMIEDAKSKGGEVIEINPADENFSQQEHRKIPPHIVLNPSDDMLVMQEEIFGPVLPVVDYATIEEAMGRINSGGRPLGLYYFGDKEEAERVIEGTTSGGVTVNDTLFHQAQDDLPFGGIGPSGMGHYHGREGFREMSHARAVYRQSPVEAVMKLTRPPYGNTIKKQIDGMIKT